MQHSVISILFVFTVVSDLCIQISEFSLAGFIVGYPFDRLRNNPDVRSLSLQRHHYWLLSVLDLILFWVQAMQVKIFIDDLCKTGKLEGVKYTFWDECFTSKVIASSLASPSGSSCDMWHAFQCLGPCLRWIHKLGQMSVIMFWIVFHLIKFSFTWCWLMHRLLLHWISSTMNFIFVIYWFLLSIHRMWNYW